MVVMEGLSLEQKLEILSDAAKYDVACTSSGVDRTGKKGTMGSASACGICHSFAADGRCISLLKILMTNECVFDCKYCMNRRSNDVLRTSFTPEEVCSLTMEFYRRNYIEGLFLSSGIRRSPDDAMEQMYRTLYLLRNERHFNGYIHVKAIPGAAPELIEATGRLADRMSINLELPTSEGLKNLAPHKTRKTILTPMRQIQRGIAAGYLEQKEKGALSFTGRRTEWRGVPEPESLPGSDSLSEPEFLPEAGGMSGAGCLPDTGKRLSAESPASGGGTGLSFRPGRWSGSFVPAGQSTQMIIGATPENDYQILSVSEALYRNFDLKRVFYSAYVALNEDSCLPVPGTPPPLLREHRLYQADWLLRFYGFRAEELLNEKKPNFNVLLDPKCDWAIGHLGQFPVEINRAPYAALLRVPGIGVKSAQRIVEARRMTALDFPDLKRMGVVLKRAHYFITCKGRLMYPTKLEEDYITRGLLDVDKKKNWELAHEITYRQLSLFDDLHMDLVVS